jgi:hypothetical protein
VIDACNFDGRRGQNKYVNNPPGTVVTPDIVSAQVTRYNRLDDRGRLFGAMIVSPFKAILKFVRLK